MPRFVSSIVKVLARTALAAVFGIAALGGAAAADSVRSHAQEMNTGKDHYAAWAAESRATAPDGLRDPSTPAGRHVEQMNEGKDHYAATDAAPGGSPALVAQARRHAEVMSTGKDHYAAWDALRSSR
jgi:hypothetical protein